MAEQTPRGIPVSDGTDVDNVPAYLALMASFLDPGPLVPYNPAAVINLTRIVFLQEGDGDPITLGIPPVLGTVFFDRTRARLWLPFVQVVSGVTTLSWYRIGADTDALVATLQGAIEGIVRTGTVNDAQMRSASVDVTLTGIAAAASTQAWQASISFAIPFATPPLVVASNGDSQSQPNVVVGVQNVTSTGFTVQIARSDVPFALNDQVTVNYVAVG